jgi:hypothetical protein
MSFNLSIMKWTFGKNLGLNWSWKRGVGFTAFRQRFARGTGVPTTVSGLNQKIGRLFTKPIINILKGK